MIDISLLKKYNEAYREGNPEISDAEYDALVAQLKKEDPDNEFFKNGIVEKPTGERMEKLPVPMFSLEKVKSVNELISWIKSVRDPEESFYLTFTPKYDGISLLYDENKGALWTRGDGVEGQRSDEWGKAMGIEKMPDSAIYKGVNFELKMPYTWGEAIISKKNFEKLQKSTSYKTARNLVAGIFNSKKPNEFTKYVEFIRYGGDAKGSFLESIKQMFFDMVNQKKGKVQKIEGCFDDDARTFAIFVPSFEMVDERLLDDKLHSLYEEWSKDYNIDGIVIAIDFIKAIIKVDLNERLSNGNPKYKIAFKDPLWSGCADTEVETITWKISKDGKSKPVINIKPVQIGGVTIKNVTGYNAKYVIDNHIARGSVIRIIRSGDVIPKHIATLNYNEVECKKMIVDTLQCSSCGGLLVWDENNVELICKSNNCRQKKIGQLVYAFSVLGCEEFGEPTLTKLYDSGYCSLQSIFCMSEAELGKIEGIGSVLAKIIYNQLIILKKDGVPLARLLTAMNFFEGKIAEKTCQKIFNNIIWEDILRLINNFEIEKLLKELSKIEGISEITAKAFIEGVKNYLHEGNVPVKISYIKEENNSFDGKMIVCMTGFRDPELSSKLVACGHKVVDNITKETTHLIVKDKNSTSSKMKKAQKMGIKIIHRDEFVW